MNIVNIPELNTGRERPIGVFDSGVGGLTVVKALHTLMPYEDIVYLGDTARVPYGTKSPETIMKFSIQNLLYLLQHDIKLAVIACNTSSAIAFPKIKSFFKIPMCGVVEAGVKAALSALSGQAGLIAVIGTQATIRSNTYQDLIKQTQPGIATIGIACPLFVPLVEEGLVEGDIPRLIAQMYLEPIIHAQQMPKVLILGCTHYPFLRGLLSGLLSPEIMLIDSADATARQVKFMPEQFSLEAVAQRKPRMEIFITDDSPHFLDIAKAVLSEEDIKIKRVHV